MQLAGDETFVLFVFIFSVFGDTPQNKHLGGLKSSILFPADTTSVIGSIPNNAFTPYYLFALSYSCPGCQCHHCLVETIPLSGVGKGGGGRESAAQMTPRVRVETHRITWKKATRIHASRPMSCCTVLPCLPDAKVACRAEGARAQGVFASRPDAPDNLPNRRRGDESSEHWAFATGSRVHGGLQTEGGVEGLLRIPVCCSLQGR